MCYNSRHKKVKILSRKKIELKMKNSTKKKEPSSSSAPHFEPSSSLILHNCLVHPRFFYTKRTLVQAKKKKQSPNLAPNVEFN
jgi:hypothetical protein